MKKVICLVIIGTFLLLTQIGSTNAYYGAGKELEGNTVSTKCWDAPTAPILTAPTNDAAVSLINVPFYWSSSTSTCPIAELNFTLQIFSDSSLTTLVNESGWISATDFTNVAMAEGHYYWRVVVQDQFGNATSSSPYHLIVDRTSPSNVDLSISHSWTKAVTETLQNGNFESGDLTHWTTAGNVSVVPSDTLVDTSATIDPYDLSAYMAVIGNSSDPGNFVWENRLMQSFSSGAKSLSLYYNFFSRDNGINDSPGFFIRLNGDEIFSQNNLESVDNSHVSTGWQQFMFDLSDITGPTLNLALYAGNTGDTSVQSWVYVNKVTTFFVSAPAAAIYHLTGADTLSGIHHFEYQIDGGVWQNGADFTIPMEGVHTLSYRAVDNAGNASALHLVNVVTDVTAPSSVSDLSATSASANSIFLSWSAPGNDNSLGRAAKYDIRYSTSPINSEGAFNAATVVQNSLPPKEAGQLEGIEVTGLDSSTLYFFALKSADEAPNWSTLSNMASETTFIGAAINPGDIVLNELFWSGSALGANDQFLELRNMTGRTLDLSTLALTHFDGSSQVDMNLHFTGKSLAPYSYFLITDSNPNGGSDLKDSLTPDLIDSNLELSSSALKIELWDGGIGSGTLIDSAWNESQPKEGIGDGTHYYSMERTDLPGDGTNPLQWYTCIDLASTTDFFDNTADERGTPGAVNRSENEPPLSLTAQSTNASSHGVLASPSASLTISPDHLTVSMDALNLSAFTKLTYVLTYDTSDTTEGVQGAVTLENTSEFHKDILLGTCSTAVCTYHQNVHSFNLELTLTKESGEQSRLQASKP